MRSSTLCTNPACRKALSQYDAATPKCFLACKFFTFSSKHNGVNYGQTVQYRYKFIYILCIFLVLILLYLFFSQELEIHIQHLIKNHKYEVNIEKAQSKKIKFSIQELEEKYNRLEIQLLVSCLITLCFNVETVPFNS